MRAAGFIGRIGGLAVARGRGFRGVRRGGCGADDSPSAGASADSHSASASKPAGPKVSGRPGAADAGRTSRKSLPAANAVPHSASPATGRFSDQGGNYHGRTRCRPHPDHTCRLLRGSAAIGLRSPRISRHRRHRRSSPEHGSGDEPQRRTDRVAAVPRQRLQALHQTEQSGRHRSGRSGHSGGAVPHHRCEKSAAQHLCQSGAVDPGHRDRQATELGQFGHGVRGSQSAIISSLAMSGLDPSLPLSFILVGNEMNPNGGFLSRFPGRPCRVSGFRSTVRRRRIRSLSRTTRWNTTVSPTSRAIPSTFWRTSTRGSGSSSSTPNTRS